MSQNSKSAGADGLGAFVGEQIAASGGSGRSRGYDDAAGLPIEALMAADANVGMATLVSESEFTMKLNAIYQRFGATEKNAKIAVRAALIAFFAVHGTSPDTAWRSYRHDVVAEGKTVPAYDVVEIVGVETLKRFMGRFGNDAIRLYTQSPDFRRKMRNRVAKANLSEEEGFLVIDFVGKDGGLDPATMQRRTNVRSQLVNFRNLDRQRVASGEASARDAQMTQPIAMASAMSTDPFN